jgi:hypothetical protein
VDNISFAHDGTFLTLLVFVDTAVVRKTDVAKQGSRAFQITFKRLLGALRNRSRARVQSLFLFFFIVFQILIAQQGKKNKKSDDWTRARDRVSQST